MKNIFLIATLLLISNSMIAQNENEVKSFPISIGYFSNFAFQPGVKIGTQFDLKNWETEYQNKKGTFTKSKSYFISPQLGFYSWLEKNSNFLVNADVGYRRIKSNRNSFSAVSIGLGYLLESEVISVVYNLSDGSIKKKNREQSHYFLPTLNYEFGKIINSKLTWYSKFSLGSKLSTQKESSMVLLFEAGVKFNIRR